jgi:hypothetical protein
MSAEKFKCFPAVCPSTLVDIETIQAKGSQLSNDYMGGHLKTNHGPHS